MYRIEAAIFYENAVVRLVERDELPGATMQRIYAYCVDGIGRDVSGAYTCEHAGPALARLEGG